MADKNPFKAFVEHERNALIEAGRALASFLPKGVREHGGNALKESAKGLTTLGSAIIEPIADVVEKILPKEQDETKAEETEEVA